MEKCPRNLHSGLLKQWCRRVEYLRTQANRIKAKTRSHFELRLALYWKGFKLLKIAQNVCGDSYRDLSIMMNLRLWGNVVLPREKKNAFKKMILSSWFRFQCPEWPGGEKIQKENLQQVQSQKRVATRRKKFTLHSELSHLQAGSALCINWEMVESSVQGYVHVT